MPKKILKIFFIITILFSLPNISLAVTPTVSNVNGTIMTGQTLVINGTNMIDENYTNWKLNDGNIGDPKDQAYFVGNTGNVSGSGHGWEAGLDTGNTATYDTTKYLLGDRSVKLINNSVCGAETSCGGVHIYGSNTESNVLPANWHVSSYINFDGEFADMYQKFFLTVGAVEQFYLNAGVNTDGTASGFYIKDGNWGNGWDKYGNFEWTKNKWHYWELEVNTADFSGDRFTMWWDGVQVAQYTFPGHSGADPHYNELGIPNWASDSETVIPFVFWINRYVFSSSRIYPASTIEVSGDGIAWKYQEPLYLSDTSSQIKLDLTGLTGTNYQLRVTNNRQETSAVYSLIGSGDVIAPNAPGGLNVL